MYQLTGWTWGRAHSLVSGGRWHCVIPYGSWHPVAMRWVSHEDLHAALIFQPSTNKMQTKSWSQIAWYSRGVVNLKHIGLRMLRLLTFYLVCLKKMLCIKIYFLLQLCSYFFAANSWHGWTWSWSQIAWLRTAWSWYWFEILVWYTSLVVTNLTIVRSPLLTWYKVDASVTEVVGCFLFSNHYKVHCLWLKQKHWC